MLLSSPVPGFVPVGERWKGNYLGYMRDSAIHMRISSRLSQSVPAYLRQETLHGLISLYYRQLGMNHYDLDVASSLKDFILSVRYTHMRYSYFSCFFGFNKIIDTAGLVENGAVIPRILASDLLSRMNIEPLDSGSESSYGALARILSMVLYSHHANRIAL